jgi:hypothetical protein
VSLRLKIIIGVLSVIVAAGVVLGDGVLHTALGFPVYLGRAAFLILLTAAIAAVLGWQWLGDRARAKRLAAEKLERRQ